MAKCIEGDKCTLVDLKALSTERFLTWYKSDRLDNYWDVYLGFYKFVNLSKELWFELEKFMWRKHHSVFQDHINTFAIIL